ncbi:MAG: signal peptide peptidase SppA [Candidatus Krumholzibacteriota bacterium]|nr:signal peptide peptidase SppA [Candidatus Krumholzibacteriota bacterium]
MSGRNARIALLLFFGFFLVILPILFLTGLDTGLDRRSAGGRTALVVEIRGRMLEYDPSLAGGLAFATREPTMTSILGALSRAERDDRVEAVVLRIRPSGAGPAKCAEIAGALGRLRAAGKRTIAFSPVLENSHYALAAAADSVFMPPAGFLFFAGPSSSALFVRGLFDKIGVSPNIHRIGEYKSAAEMLTETRRTPESRSMIERLLAVGGAEIAAAVAAGRGVPVDTVLSWLEDGLFSPRRAAGAGLIDGLRHWDEVETALEESGLRLVGSREYGAGHTGGLSAIAGSAVAVVHAQGAIVLGESGFDPVEGMTMGSETIIRELRRARDDPRVRAIVLRVDSPGGSGIAGGLISREVEMAAAVKPVVVSMSDVAASGGYEIAYRADSIFAMPVTVTGSIGSITGKLNLRGLYERLGIAKDEIGTGPLSLIWSDYRDFSDREWEAVRREHTAFYLEWIGEIARSRGMTPARVDSLGQGRVWTGRDAARNGLVDGLGGLDRAVDAACRLAGIDDAGEAVLVHLPERAGLLRSLLAGDLFGNAAAGLFHRAVVEDRRWETFPGAERRLGERIR